jgi:hypothetical protein
MSTPQPHAEDRESKLVIDEDWKARVQAEKEAAQQSGAASGSQAATASQHDAAHELPPPSLALHVHSLATEALVFLGQLPNPYSQQSEVDLRRAQFVIDTIQMLYEKTQGNATPEESRLFDDVLHELRMAYLRVHSAQRAVRT